MLRSQLPEPSLSAALQLGAPGPSAVTVTVPPGVPAPDDTENRTVTV
jgi:hypothetical protein